MKPDNRAQFDYVFRKATGYGPFEYQRALACAPQLPALVRAPTGSGKTAAATLAWLFRRRFHPEPEVRKATPRRLVYCLPMRVLVEQTVDAVESWIRNLGLTGEMGVYRLMGGISEDDWVRRPNADAVLVGTMDMLLSRALNRGYAAGRARWPLEFGLLNSDCFWVFDEIQLMGSGLATSCQLAAFRKIFGRSRPSRSIWMSATAAPEWLMTVDHPKPSDSEVLTIGANDLKGDLKKRFYAPKTLRQLNVPGWPEGAADEIISLHRPGTLTLVVVNTVERARKIFEDLKSRAPAGIDVRLIHSRFRPPDRQAAVQALLASVAPEGRIVVATQVVEAGVDVSAATLVTEVAPWGSLVQRFGRCNRFAEFENATIVWVDLDRSQAKPYEPDELDDARKILRKLEGRSVSPAALETEGPGRPPRVIHVIRRQDLVDLFDTEPDLGGNDVDVSRFIRDDADVDLHVFWRRWDGEVPPADLDQPAANELCPVPVWEVRDFLKNRRAAAYVWDHLEREWRRIDPDELRPGRTVLLHADKGGYRPDVGWDPGSRAEVEPVEEPPAGGPADDTMGGDESEEVSGAWVPLAEHLVRVRDRTEQLLDAIDIRLEPWECRAVLAAALWHDVGKAHRVFQEALLRDLTEAERATRAGQLWAKSEHGRGRLDYERRHFRHELASALALLALPREVHCLDGDALDLAAYLAAAHHGKVRMAIRALRGEDRPEDPDCRFARGVWDGDELGPLNLAGTTMPRVRLDLSIMEVGRNPDGQRSWVERVLRLRDRLGPFRLAFLEAILRLADWQVSAEEGERA